MPTVKVTYFDATGRAELTRLLLAAGNIAFEDERIEGADFPALKPTLPLGQLPVITIDGATYPQSMAMARYAARLSGLYPSDALEALKVDSVVESILDGASTMVDIKWRTQDEAAKAEKTKKFLEELLPKIFAYIEGQVKGNFVLGASMTFADVAVFDFLVNGVNALFPDAFKIAAYPKVSAVIANVKSNANIAAYLAK